jgi:hypothetical protein
MQITLRAVSKARTHLGRVIPIVRTNAAHAKIWRESTFEE